MNLLKRVVLGGIVKMTIIVFSGTVITVQETGLYYLSSTIFLLFVIQLL